MNPQELTLEQQFKVQAFNTMADQMSREQAISLLKMLNQHIIVQQAVYLELLKKHWNIDGKLNSRQSEGESAS